LNKVFGFMIVITLAVEDQMFLGMQDFDYAQINQICPNLITFPKFRFKFAQI